MQPSRPDTLPSSRKDVPAGRSFLSRAVAFVDGSLVSTFVVLAYAYFFVIILAEVTQRYFFAHSSPWGEMTARYAFVYFAYLAAAEAFRHDEHIRIDYVPGRLGPKARMILESYIDLLCLGIACAVIWYSLDVIAIQKMANIRMHSLPLNMSWAQAALPLGWGLMIIRIIQRARRRWFHPDKQHTGVVAK